MIKILITLISYIPINNSKYLLSALLLLITLHTAYPIPPHWAPSESGALRWVCVGVDSGAVLLMRFSCPVADLLTRSRSEGLTHLTWQVRLGQVFQVEWWPKLKS